MAKVSFIPETAAVAPDEFVGMVLCLGQEVVEGF